MPESMSTSWKKEKFEKQDRISWDDFFMQIALTASKRTSCIFHKIASVFVDSNHKIISIGYNGPSTGDVHCHEVGCAKVHGNPVTGEMKRCRGAHSEINAIINSGNTARFKGSTLYITTFPCYDCMKELNNLGVTRIVYYKEYMRIVDGGKRKIAEPEAWELADRRGIILEKYRSVEEKETKNEVGEKKLEKSRW
jgi:dCMP deaminase